MELRYIQLCVNVFAHRHQESMRKYEQFGQSENLIGSLPLTWNWLVSEYDYNVKADNVHFTLGGPYFKGYEKSDYANEWFRVYDELVKIDL